LTNLEISASAPQQARDLLSATRKLPGLRDYALIHSKAHEQAMNLLLKLGGKTGGVENTKAITQHLNDLH
jgi:hypothetical protein